MERVFAAPPEQRVVVERAGDARAGDPELGRQVVRALVVDLKVEEA